MDCAQAAQCMSLCRSWHETQWHTCCSIYSDTEELNWHYILYNIIYFQYASLTRKCGERQWHIPTLPPPPHSTVTDSLTNGRKFSGSVPVSVQGLQQLKWWQHGLFINSYNSLTIGLTHARSSAVTDKPPDATALWWISAIYRADFTTCRGQLLTPYWPDFPTFTYSSPIWRPQWGEFPWAIRFIFDMGKLEWMGDSLVKVAWWSTRSFGHNTSTWQTHNHFRDRQPRRLSNAVASGVKNPVMFLQHLPLPLSSWLPLYVWRIRN